jgi:hypothetical protein
VIAIVLTRSPLQKPGSHRRFCSGVASVDRYRPATSLCRLNAGLSVPQRANSSLRMTW